jgi:hypothetical protein
MRNDLLKLYTEWQEDFREIVTRFGTAELHGPLLISPSDTYSQQKNRLLIIGQETYGWNIEADDLEKQMKAYEDFNVGAGYYSSPFWNVVRKVEKAISNSPYSCAWTNISKYDLHGGRAYGEYEAGISRLDNLLVREMQYLNRQFVCSLQVRILTIE